MTESKGNGREVVAQPDNKQATVPKKEKRRKSATEERMKTACLVFGRRRPVYVWENFLVVPGFLVLRTAITRTMDSLENGSSAQQRGFHCRLDGVRNTRRTTSSDIDALLR